MMLPRALIGYDYPKGFVIRRVNNSGDISWHKGRVFVSQVLRFEDLGFELVAEDFYKVFFRDVEIGEFEVETLRSTRPFRRMTRIPSYEQLHEMGKAVAAGVQVVIAPQLFPTPPELADRMVALADIRPGQQRLEPSAGTSRIIDAIRRNAHGYAITAVELNCNMAHRLRTVDCVADTRQADFLGG